MKFAIYDHLKDGYVRGFTNVLEFESHEDAVFHAGILANKHIVTNEFKQNGVASVFETWMLNEATISKLNKKPTKAPKKPLAERSTLRAGKDTAHKSLDCFCGFWMNSGFNKFCPCDGEKPKSDG